MVTYNHGSSSSFKSSKLFDNYFFFIKPSFHNCPTGRKYVWSVDYIKSTKHLWVVILRNFTCFLYKSFNFATKFTHSKSSHILNTERVLNLFSRDKTTRHQMLLNEYFIALKITGPKVIFITYFPNFIRVNMTSLFNVNRSSNFVNTAVSSLVVRENFRQFVKFEFFDNVV